ncbi:DUF4942 domain-containing protein [Vibrio splendidus]
MKPSMSVINPNIIEILVQQRHALIEQYCESVRLQRSSMQIAIAIDKAIPSNPIAMPGSFDTVFYDIAMKLGETSKKRVQPRMSDLIKLTDKKLVSIVTQTVDNNLWEVLFKRLGYFSRMSAEQKRRFDAENAANPLPFTLDNAISTLGDFHQRSKGIIVEGLIDILKQTDSGYSSNSPIKLGRRWIIKNVFSSQSMTLSSHTPLINLLNLVWQLIEGHALRLDEHGLPTNEIIEDLRTKLSQHQDASRLKYVEVYSLRFDFFENGNVHVYFPDTYTRFINNLLAEERSLYKG